MLAKTATLIPYNITVYDAKFMGVYLKSFNDGQEKHIDLSYNSDAEHVDVITSMKGLFSVRVYCYACHKRFSTVKHLCAASSCTECRMPKCRNRASTAFNTDFFGQQTCSTYRCQTCGLSLKSQLCLDAHLTQRICSYFWVQSYCFPALGVHSSMQQKTMRYLFSILRFLTRKETRVFCTEPQETGTCSPGD